MTSDYRIRKTPAGYRIWQRIGPGWEALHDHHPTREAARAWIAERPGT